MPIFNPIVLAPVLHQANKVTTDVTVDYRSRFERRTDRDFASASRDNRTDWLQRGRIGLKWVANPNLSGLVQYQYTHTLSWTPARNFSTEHSDIYQMYAQFVDGPNKYILGRQTINFGTERLVGSAEWVDTGRSYDAIRVQNKQFDAFAGAIGVNTVYAPDVRLGGFAVNHAYGYTGLIYKHDERTAGDIDLMTLNHLCRRPLGGVNFEFEGALQFGQATGKDVRSWAYHVQASKDLNPSDKLTLEYNVASGGSNANTTFTFDNLYPTNHKFYGLMDLHSWKNINMLAATWEHKFNANQVLKARYGTSTLRDPRDAWYSASGAPNRRNGGVFQDLTGASGRNIGQEFDLEFNIKADSTSQFSFGLGFFAPGSFIRNIAGERKTQTFGYAMYSVRF